MVTPGGCHAGLMVCRMTHTQDVATTHNPWYALGMSKAADYLVGKRVELSPATDAWMRGDRFGKVVKVTAQYVHVRMDKSGKTLKVNAQYIGSVVS